MTLEVADANVTAGVDAACVPARFYRVGPWLIAIVLSLGLWFLIWLAAIKLAAFTAA